MEHPENSAEYAGLQVNAGVEQPSMVNPYLKQMRKKRQKLFTPAEYVEGILKGNVSMLSQAVTLIESVLPEHQAIAQEVIEKCLPYSGKSVRIGISGVPGAGKSTGAAYVFSKLKMQGINAELVTEFAKDMVWENNNKVLMNQEYIFGSQSYRLSRCKDKVDVIVTDCPLFLTAFYNKSSVLGNEFNKVVLNVFNTYNNVNYLIDRIKDFNPIGRVHTEQQARNMREPLIKMLKDYNVPFETIEGTVKDYDAIVEDVSEKVKGEKENSEVHRRKRYEPER